MEQLSQPDIQLQLAKLKGWDLINDSNIQKLKAAFPTSDYNRAIALTNAIARLAESANHHPLIIVEYACVTVIWWTHQINGLHKNDFIMAAKTTELFLNVKLSLINQPDSTGQNR